jgi:AraC family transcriptional regulator
MVCIRCKMAVSSVLDSLDIPYKRIELGWAELDKTLEPAELAALDGRLRRYELELMTSKRAILVERIKNIIVEMVRSSNMATPLKFTVYLSNKLGYDYTYMSNTFSEEEGSTIERFYISTRIERVKELLVYEGKSIKEIAFELNYSSVSHLSLQFKKVTGQTLSAFRKSMETADFVWKECK